MFKLFISLFVLSTFLNASFHPVDAYHSKIAEITDSQYCYSRSLVSYNVQEYDATNIGESNEVSYYCFNHYKTTASSAWIDADICDGPSVSSQEEGVPQGSTVVLQKRAWYFTKKLCTSFDNTKDEDGVDIIYVDGIPYDVTSIENGKYFNTYDNVLVCNAYFLAINNDSCIQPNYDERNMADAILKRDKIARENNLSNVSGINADSISYNDNGSIQSFSFTAQGSDGSIQSIFTEFNENDPVFTVEEDGTITETPYVPNNDNTTGSDGSTTDTTTDGTTNTDGLTPGTDDTSHQLTLIADSLHNLTQSDNVTNEHLDNIEFNISQINETLNPDLRNTTLENPLEDSDTYYDNYVIPQIQDLITNFTNDFNSLKDTYVEKITYIKENGFEFDYASQLYETCPMNFTLNPFQDFEDSNIKDEELSLNIDVCSLMANAKLPNSETSILSIFYTIFYTFFYTVILIGIFKLAALTFRSF